MKDKVLFIDRDGCIIVEPKSDKQGDSLEKLEFLPGVISALSEIRKKTDYKFVMVTNQDGLGTDSFPEDTFLPAQNKMLKTLEGEGIVFDDIFIDESKPEDKSPNRKPGTGMLGKYINGNYDLANSIVIGDRDSDVELAINLGAKAIQVANKKNNAAILNSTDWCKIAQFIISGSRKAEINRKTKETDINIKLNLDGSGKSSISTGLEFFNHMLEQISKHGLIDLEIKVDGDLKVDEHHTIEDTGIALGQAVTEALGSKKGIQRYGFLLPMDDCLAQVAIDFSGRNELVWNADFKREKVGDMPTEMFKHFFKSFTDSALCNLNIKAEGENEHHKIEAIFKAFAKSVRFATERDARNNDLPSTKGIL